MSPPPSTIPRVLAIAGSDSGGGAGIQADLKAFARSGVHGMTAITAITAQNTVEVRAVEPVSPAMIVAQVQAVVQDIGVDAVKVGMLGTRETIAAVAEALELLPPATAVVLDPVMVAESGAPLLEPAARDALVGTIVPRASVVTPNLQEAAALARLPESDPPEALARGVHALGPEVVVVTGGHREEAIDVYFDGDRLEMLPGPRFADGASHGSGCTHSSTLAAQLALGASALEAARTARRVAAEAVGRGLHQLGGGAGPVAALALDASSTAPTPLA
jgi:hydroxymethylpyrimidine/phosphomethylpyrimidine kinase